MPIVKYKVAVSGKTYGAERQLMNKVRCQMQDGVKLVECSEGHQITVLFCPVVSRVGSDVEAAMSDVKGKENSKIIKVLNLIVIVSFSLISCPLSKELQDFL